MAATADQLACLVSPQIASLITAAGAGPVDLSAQAANPGTSELPGSVVVMQAGIPGFLPLLEAYALHRPDAAMLLIGDDLPSEAVRALFRFAVSDVMSGHFEPAALVRAIEDLDRKRSLSASASGAPQGAQCWALRGAVGGAGVTTIAIEMAFAVLKDVPSSRVALIDLNLADGSSASFLDAQKKMDIAAICANPSRIDASLVGAYSFEHPKGIFLLACPRNPRADEQASMEGVLHLLDVACSMYDHVVIDLPRHRTPWSEPVLGAADEAFVISELTVPSLHAAADLCRDTDEVRLGRPTRLVLNRMFAKRSHRHSFPLEKAENAIHRKVDHTIRSDWESARMAVNLGMPVAQVKAKSPLVKDVQEIVAERLTSIRAGMRQAA